MIVFQGLVPDPGQMQPVEKKNPTQMIIIYFFYLDTLWADRLKKVNIFEI